jgi:transposase
VPKTRRRSTPPVLNLDTAGIDIGATEIYVAVPDDRDDRPIRRFGTFTEDLHRIADWLKSCRIRSIAMESTGVYWIPLFQVLETRGFEVCLVNARHVKNVPGRKTDVQDCQWLQYLHSVGLLRGSFRPPDEICVVRTLLRHRDTLIQMASSHVQRMQKSLNQMNLQLHHVISDITGVTGLAILDAILAGERDPDVLAQFRHPRMKASKAVIAKALVGDYRREHIFTLRQSLAAYRHDQALIAETDMELQQLLATFDSRADPVATNHRRTQRNELRFDLQAELHRVLGVDLTQIPGLGTGSAYSALAEVGPDLSRFPSDKHFASWLALCPDNRISGGAVLSVRTRHVKHRLAQALRLAAQSLFRSQTALGAYYRRMRTRLGTPKAITATAHKLARILYRLLTTRQPYDESVLAVQDERRKKRLEHHLRRQARTLGFTLSPVAQPDPSVS